MSINVNVTGNPVKIHRGKMVTASSDYAKDEFQKRRRMRLEQVRQQSKDIAETVRNKVRREKNKQLSGLEKRGEEELKKWQSRKLLQLQQQYRECLKDIGLGHSEAALEEESDYAVESRKENYEQVAKERGQKAVDKLRMQRHQECSDKSAGFQKRRYNQAIESTRAKLVADLNRKKKSQNPFKKKKRKVSTDINISSRLSSESDSENDVPELLNLSSSSSSSSTSKKLVTKDAKKYASAESKESTDYVATTDAPTRMQMFAENQNEVVKKRIESISSPTRQKVEEDVSRSSVSYPVDTRISDRIKNRKIINDNYECRTDICDIPVSGPMHGSRKALTIHSDNPSMPRGSLEKSSQPENPKIKPVSSIKDVQLNPEKCNSASKPRYSKDEQEQIPSKPTVTLRTAPESSNQLKSFVQSSAGSNKVQYYDHKNRFTKEYVADEANVQKIPEDSVQVCPSTGSEAEFMEQMYKRDRDAQVRGQKALEKEKIHRDYREMMQQLPVLQKQERIAAIPSKKPTFHMSEDRLKQYEKKRQNRMENAYEKLFPKPRVITIPPKVQTKSSTVTGNLPFQTIDIDDSHPSLNVGSWDFDVKPKSIPAPDLAPRHVESNLVNEVTEKVLGERTDPETAAAERKENLQEMLRSLQFHRDKLARELSSLPENSTLHKLFGELSNIDKLIQIGQTAEKESRSSRRRKRSRSKRKQQNKEESNSKVSSSSLSPSYKLEKSPKALQKGREHSREKDRKVSKYHVRCTSGSSTSPSPPSKILSTIKTKAERKGTRPSPLVLQNTSTQTTPTVERPNEVPTKGPENGQRPIAPKASSARTKIDGKNIGPCECYLHTGNGKSELCEIVIKISEDGKPQICVSPTRLKDKQIIVKTGAEEMSAVSVEPSPEVTGKQPEKAASPDRSKSKLGGKPKIPDKPKITDKQKVVDDRDGKTKSKSHGKPEKQKPSSSWREYLSQNSTSSTSYFSPPDFTSTHFPQFYSKHPQHFNAFPKPGGHLINILKDKPQQSNLQDDSTMSNVSSAIQSSKSVEPHLFCYIKKLLTMSRGSIDDLPVSSVSEISTPSSSIVNVHSNVPLQQLKNIMRHFNINMSDFEGFLNYSPDGSNLHYNTAESLTLSPSDGPSPANSTSNSRSNSEAKLQDIRATTLDDFSAENYPGVLAVYNKLAENCARKIENLATMIEKVRLEKVNMLQSPDIGSDKENSTKYLGLPPELRQRKDKGKKSSSPSSSAEQEELDRQLLEIDYNFAERLKKMTPAEIREQFPLSDNSGLNDESSQQRDSIDQELMKRFRNLVEGHKSGVMTNSEQFSGPAACTSKTKDEQTKTQNSGTPFVPLLMDIPRLPKLEPPSVQTGLHRHSERSKPPPSKGLTVAKRFNNDISAVPHELSTIAESESLVSSRLHRSKTPESQASNKAVSPKRGSNLDEHLVPLVVLPTARELQSDKNSEDPGDIAEIVEESSNKPHTSSSDSLPDILAELMKNATAQVEPSEKPANKSAERKYKTETLKQLAPKNTAEPPSDSSASELENMEAMLKSLGMGWAVATLRKTQEALALTSSSSSTDISLKQKEIKVTDTSSTSEISLREILGRQFLKKLSSSNGKSEDTNGSSQFLRELQDLSAISGPEMSYEKTTQRTSTPVQGSKSADKSKSDSQPRMTITGESELSSVKANSDNNCDGVYFYSLHESSVRSKSSTKND